MQRIRITRTHLAVLLALALGWIASDLTAGATDQTLPDMLPPAEASSIYPYDPTSREFVLFTIDDSGRAITAWKFKGESAQTGALPLLQDVRHYTAR